MKEKIGKCIVLNIYADCDDKWRPNNFDDNCNSYRIREDESTIEINIFADCDNRRS